MATAEIRIDPPLYQLDIVDAFTNDIVQWTERPFVPAVGDLLLIDRVPWRVTARVWDMGNKVTHDGGSEPSREVLVRVTRDREEETR